MKHYLAEPLEHNFGIRKILCDPQKYLFNLYL